MSDQYDADMVAQYDRGFTEIPLRRYVELPSVYQILGDVTGLCVLDLACGTGYYAKELRRRGAARVVGADLSEAMIRATRAQEEKAPLGVEYVHADAGALEHLGDFNVVTGIHLLHYASSLEHLNGMCQSISRHLKPAGRFIGYQLNYDVARKPHYYDKYGFNLRISEQARDGQPFIFSVTLGDYTSPDITAYYWSKQSLESALHDAGLTGLRWVAPAPSPEGIEKQGADFWADVMRSPFELIVIGTKS
ncbi:MAG: class I SAM-dependent methyltransferase [Acidobacteria bacterium]|nr:class I SAM-dependent methyltransferase [Acidobacteriota bacterium]